MQPNVFDRVKIRAIIHMRRINALGVERWSKHTFRRPSAPVQNSGPLALMRASDYYDSPGLPAVLQVPRVKPTGAKLSLGYLLPYYYFDGGLFSLYRYWPIREQAPWAPEQRWNRAFPRNTEGWEDATTDAGYTRLRLQGPNPFLLRRIDALGGYEVDYTPHFRGVFAPVVCRFRLRDGQLRPESIQIGQESPSVPGSASWERAKLVANALDARYSVFVRHLLHTHLIIGAAFALSAYWLPAGHPLRPFLDFFTYGTLAVNDFAYRLLITPASYFIQSKFISVADTMTLFHNGVAEFSLGELVVPKDVARRGIDQIPGHPYVEDALESWGTLHEFVASYLHRLYATDAAVAADAALQSFYATLLSLLPDDSLRARPLASKAALEELLTCLLYNNVSHKICGDFSPYGQSLNAEHKRLVDFERLKRGDFTSQPSLADVFLFDQGAFAAGFGNGGNNLMTIPVSRFVGDAGLAAALVGLQDKLRTLDRRLEDRNELREEPFYRAMPRNWDVSISF